MKKIIKKITLTLVWTFSIALFLVSQISLFGIDARAQSTSTDTTSQTDDLKDSISSLKDKLEKEQKAAEKLEQNLGQIKSAVSSTDQQINKSKNVIAQTQKTITEKEQEIENLNNKVDLQKELLKSFLQQVYYIKNQPLASVVISQGNLTDIFGNVDNFVTVNDKIQETLDDIALTQQEIEQDKLELAQKKEEHLQIVDEKMEIKQNLVADQMDVAQDLESKQQKIDKLNKELSELQGDLNKILGRSYNAADIKEAVNFASGKTGVPKGFLYGMLKMETNLGANVGGCTYGEVEKGAESSYKAKKLSARAWKTFQTRREIFKTICSELDIDYKKQKVSCNPRGYVGTGGAMGVAQFMPDTWNGYKSQVSSITGNNPPSPWSLTDGVTAMAVKLKRTPGVTDGKKSALKSAACSYLGTCYAPYINGILYWADHYKELID